MFTSIILGENPLPNLEFLEIGLTKLDKSVVEATLKRCPKLKKAHV